LLYRLLALVTASAALLLGGCATPQKMAFSDNANEPVKTDKALYLMTATIKNNYKTSYQPQLMFTSLEKGAAENREDRLNFKIDDSGTIAGKSEEDGNTYLLRLELDNGQYVVRGFNCMSRSLFIISNFFAPLHAAVNATTPGVYYLGHVDATVRERTGNEFKAGAPIPLIDQAVAGASSGTFDVAITDRWTQDESLFKNKYPALKKATINKSVLPAFDRDAAQKWWEAH
jgi:hypothetical protein